MYTLESLRPLNTVYLSEHRLEQSDVEKVNAYIRLIEGSRSERPCPGDIIEFTDEYGDYDPNAHIRALDEEMGRISLRICPHVPFIFPKDDGQAVAFSYVGGGLSASVGAASLTYIGKREKFFAIFGNHILPAHSAIYFKAQVNVWEYIAPDQKHPGYSKSIAAFYAGKGFLHKPIEDMWNHKIPFILSATSKTVMEEILKPSVPRYTGNGFSPATPYHSEAEELPEYKAVEFPGASPNQIVLFLYRETDRLVSRKEWDALDLPLDTRFVNGIIHVKVACDDDAHMITTYRFTNSGYLDARRFVAFERARGTVLAALGPEIREEYRARTT